jgi:hypothetical protein
MTTAMDGADQSLIDQPTRMTKRVPASTARAFRLRRQALMRVESPRTVEGEEKRD